jgi:hypothetical protein
MTITDIATYIREQTGVTVANVTDAQLYRAINISYHEIENAIVTNLNEDWFWNEIISSLMANQEEYTNDTLVVGNVSGTNKILAVSIDYTGNGNFTPATYTSSENIENKRLNSSEASPLYTIVDNSIIIFPKPKTAVTEGLKMRVVQNLVDLTSGTTESNIFNGKIHTNNHYFIALGAFEHIYRQRQLENDAVNARRVFLSKIYGDGMQDIGLLGRLNNRTVSTMTSSEPNTTKFR